ncbi:hypothetical protein [Streptomyces sp. NBC_01750]|uniref:hypothetical protein n=1 Tax=Streptomyces sp. NBC_01750 TaxID=2975928 RepID=UPI002DDA0E94|nr:hypothetical protein [Streptomyces sp. NBC_01750]WSD30707.1 hypothetical protein OG966_01160 [Streptomyces sp. NBC_01750]
MTEQITQADQPVKAKELPETAQPVEAEQPAECEPNAEPEPTVEAETAQPAAPGKPPLNRRVLRVVAPWTAAVIVCAGLGAGTAFGITSMERSDVPGLATESDGRWDYPRLSLPALPKGSPRPFTFGNRHEIHHADLRKLLLPAPAGATVDKKLTGDWVSSAQYLSEYGDLRHADIQQALDDCAVRQIAARGWTMPDGTASRVYLLRFDSAGMAQAFKDMEIGVGLSPDATLKTAPGEVGIDEEWEMATRADGQSLVSLYTEAKPFGPEHTRQAYIQAGDTLALIIHARKGEVAPTVPFHQTVVLQNQLLS